MTCQANQASIAIFFSVALIAGGVSEAMAIEITDDHRDVVEPIYKTVTLSNAFADACSQVNPGANVMPDELQNFTSNLLQDFFAKEPERQSELEALYRDQVETIKSELSEQPEGCDYPGDMKYQRSTDLTGLFRALQKLQGDTDVLGRDREQSAGIIPDHLNAFGPGLSYGTLTLENGLTAELLGFIAYDSVSKWYLDDYYSFKSSSAGDMRRVLNFLDVEWNEDGHPSNKNKEKFGDFIDEEDHMVSDLFSIDYPELGTKLRWMLRGYSTGSSGDYMVAIAEMTGHFKASILITNDNDSWNEDDVKTITKAFAISIYSHNYPEFDKHWFFEQERWFPYAQEVAGFPGVSWDMAGAEIDSVDEETYCFASCIKLQFPATDNESSAFVLVHEPSPDSPIYSASDIFPPKEPKEKLTMPFVALHQSDFFKKNRR